MPRDVAAGADAASELAAELLRGPTEDERELGFTTALPDDLDLSEIAVVGDVAHVDLERELSPEGLAQLVYTLTGLPGVRTVDLEGGATLVTGFDRDDFEELTPAILVETPLVREEVASPLRVTGTANTFEANFQYELTDADGRVIAENFVTATSGYRHARNLRVHRAVRVRRRRHADRLRELGEGRLAHQRRRDPPPDDAVIRHRL